MNINSVSMRLNTKISIMTEISKNLCNFITEHNSSLVSGDSYFILVFLFRRYTNTKSYFISFARLSIQVTGFLCNLNFFVTLYGSHNQSSLHKNCLPVSLNRFSYIKATLLKRTNLILSEKLFKFE